MRTLLAVMALVSCKPDVDLHGTYEGSATGFYHVDGKRVDFTLPNETITIETTAREYQHYSYRTTVRGCSVTGDGSATSTLANHGTCAFRLPTVGPITFTPLGGVSMENGHLHLSLGGSDGDRVTDFGYMFDAKSK